MKSNDATDSKKLDNPTSRRVLHFLRHILIWVVLAAALFYALHRYFEYREQQLEQRLEQLSVWKMDS